MVLNIFLPNPTERMEQVFISLGSNLGDRLANLRQAILSLHRIVEITAISDAYETQPVEFTDQPWFLNAVVAVASADPPELLLERLLAIELSMGRRRAAGDFIPKGPRLIDLDLLLMDDVVVKSAELTLPHPAMWGRRFVLEPLAEIAPAMVDPLSGRSVSEMLARLGD